MCRPLASALATVGCAGALAVSRAPAQESAKTPEQPSSSAARQASKAAPKPVPEAPRQTVKAATARPAETAKAATAAPAETAKGATKPAPREPIELRPYRILLYLRCAPSARVDAARRAALLRDWHVMVRRFIGAPWVVTIAEPSSPLANLDLESIAPDQFSGLSSFDKVWLVVLARGETESRFVLSGREYDIASRRIGPLQHQQVEAFCDAPRALLEFSRDLFSPTAEISSQEGGRAILNVQGAAIPPASPLGAVVTKGTVFQALRLVSLRDGKLQILRIPFTYLQVESVEGPIARCAITSALRDPLTKRVSRPSALAALGLKPGNIPLKLRFVTRPDSLPAAGYMLTARLVPDGQPRELGTTDRSGRIVLQPGFAHGLVILRLLAGNVEPMVELPMMPGESSDERTIPFDPKPLTVALEAKIDSLRDEVVDLVALRARLEARMKARLEGEDWPGLEGALKEFARLTPRDELSQRLTKLKDDAANQQAELNKAVLTKTAQAQINDLQSMLDRYLDDETYRAYSEAFEQTKRAVDAKSKAAAKKTAAAPRPRTEQPVPRSPTTARTEPAKPAAPAPPAAQPAPRRPLPPQPATPAVPF
jgi:hypothetical protein